LQYLDEDIGIGTAKDVFVVVWRERTTLETVARACSEFQSYANSWGRELAMMVVVEEHAKMPDPGAREAIASFLATASDKLVIAALVYEGQGFVAASIRGVVIGLTLLARQPYPYRVFASVGEAAQWFFENENRIGRRFSAENITSDVMTLRRRMTRSSQFVR
jgi:hypothetical protein